MTAPAWRNIDLRKVARAAWWVGLLVAFVALRAKSAHPLLNIDELIPIRVSEAMRLRGILDPNWRHADLPEFLRVDQYNFYLYNIAAHYVLAAATWIDRPPLLALRNANVFFQLLGLAFALDALRRIGVGRFGLAVAGVLIVLAPGMVQDAGMGRPESFLYLMSALLVWVLALPLRERWRMLLAGAVLGAGIAVKLSFASLGVMLPFLVGVRGTPTRALAASAACLTLGLALGIVACAPYAVIHHSAYLSGLAALAAQYAGAHPPHSLPNFGFGAQLVWILRYFFELYGLAPLAACAAPFLLRNATRQWAIGLLAAWLALVVYFATKPVFFERNLSHALIPMLLAAVLGVSALRRPAWRGAAVAMIILPAGYWSIQIAAQTRQPESIARFEAAHGLNPKLRVFFAQVYTGEVPRQCETIAVQTFNDPWSAAYLARLAQERFEPIARYRSRFAPLVTSTLHTYLDPDMHYFRCPPT